MLFWGNTWKTYGFEHNGESSPSNTTTFILLLLEKKQVEHDEHFLKLQDMLRLPRT